MKHCDSCMEQVARYRVVLSGLRPPEVSEVLDTVDLCLECLTTAKILDVLTPGAVDTGEPNNV